jgi:hypothetical protein
MSVAMKAFIEDYQAEIEKLRSEVAALRLKYEFDWDKPFDPPSECGCRTPVECASHGVEGFVWSPNDRRHIRRVGAVQVDDDEIRQGY